MPVEITPLNSNADALGESPIWDPRQGALYWCDLLSGTLQRLLVSTGVYQTWDFGEPMGSVALHADGHLLVPGLDTLYYFDQDRREKTPFPHQPITTRQPLERFNDSACDANGYYWLGSAARDITRPEGRLYRIGPNGDVLEAAGGYHIANGITWSQDGSVMYHADSGPAANCIYRYTFDPKGSTLIDRSVLIRFTAAEGYNDGITIDHEDHLWVAFWEGGCLRRISPDGEVVQTLTMPAPRMTACVFGGVDYATLYATSCAQDFGEQTRLPLPSGQVFAVTGSGCRGLAPMVYQGWSP